MKKKKEKGQKKEKLKNEPEISFNVHKMPKDYKTGRFNSSKTKLKMNSKKESFDPPEKHKKNKKIGIFIAVFGAIFILFLSYLVYSYIKDPNFSLFNIFESKSGEKELIVEEEPVEEELVEEEEEEVEEEPVGEEEPVEEDPIEEEEEEVEEEPVEEEEEEVEEEVFPSAIDSDEDGLSDKEEEVLGTDPLNPNTDEDDYDDLTEVLNLYNPLGDGKLAEAETVDEYRNDKFSYSVLYPNAWDENVLSDESSAFLYIDDDSFIQVLVEDNEARSDIEEWYASRFFDSFDESNLVEEDTWTGIYSEDNLVLYLTDKDSQNIYTILYSLSENSPRYHENIFSMIINSFTLH